MSKAKEDRMIEAEAGVMHFESGGRGHEPGKAGTGKDEVLDSPLEPSEGMQACQQLDFCPMRFILDF